MESLTHNYLEQLTMRTTDFTGSYDYEKAEALHAAEVLRDDLEFGSIEPHEVEAYIEQVLAKWQASLSADSFAEFKTHYLLLVSEVR